MTDIIDLLPSSSPHHLRGRQKRRARRHAEWSPPVDQLGPVMNMYLSHESQVVILRGRDRRSLKRHINHGCTGNTALLQTKAYPDASLHLDSKPLVLSAQQTAMESKVKALPSWLVAVSLERPRESKRLMLYLKNQKQQKELFLTLALVESIIALGLERQEMEEEELGL